MPTSPAPARRILPYFLASQSCSTLSYQMLAVAFGWQVYALAHSVFYLGLIGLAQFTPQLALTLIVGQAADRFDRRRIAQCAQLAQVAGAFTLALACLTDHQSLALIFGCAMLTGAARAFESPSMQSLLPTLVEEGHLPKSLAMAASARQTAVIVGPAVGGLVFVLGAASVYLACVAAYLSAAGLLSRLPAGARAASKAPISLQSALAGVHFIRERPVLFGAISLDLFSVLLGGATALLPVYARDILHTGPWGLGLLRAAPAIGALGMSLYLARHPLHRHVGRKMGWAVALFGASTIVFGLSRWFVPSLLSLVVLGASDMVSVVVRSSLVQLETPDAMRGRVSAVNFIFIGTSNQLGEFESGITAAWFGTVPAVVLGGIGTLAVVALWRRWFPALFARDTFSQH
ncbi:MAG: MFS transporter [Paludibacterium sp.]|uniref:MFS transporter n=1 Tax=Paludibacterium sp. TaxID=1917523 RepID=UPI0025F91BF4|nr:MFS transporter [Paludibacterium sp.]MBV8047118.1 MFS transporter [Paludibacterium sp.]MBV8648751.1 MFS transporter [Paludibacterium sp.]